MPKKSVISRMEKEEDKEDIKIIQGEKNIIRKVQAFFHLHIDNYGTKYGVLMEGFFFLINFLAIALFVAETLKLSESSMNFIHISELVLVSIFIVEYAIRMWVAEKKIKHFFNIYSLIDLVAIVPVVVAFVNLGFVRIFRILRIFRVLRAMRVLRFQRALKSSHTIFGDLSETKLIIGRIILTIFTIIFVSSGFIWAIESRLNPEGFGTILHAMYFSIVTLTTVGYGDVTPISMWGKVVAVLMIISGVALIPWQVGKLIQAFVFSKTKVKVVCSKCGLGHHDPDAVHCKLCGHVIKRKKEEKKVP